MERVLSSLTNAVIYYNTRLVSQVYYRKQAAAEDHAAMDVIQGLLPVAWQHTNWIGQFDFSVAQLQSRHRHLGCSLL